MEGRVFERDYESHSEFYKDVYGDAIREVRPAGRLGTVMIMAEQEAGDWSDASSPDLVVSILAQHGPAATINVGAGRFRRPAEPPGDLIVLPPGTATTFLVDGPHAVRFICLPYRELVGLAGEEAGLPRDGDFGALHARMHRDNDVSTLLERIWQEARTGSPHGSLWADGAILQLAACLLRLRDGKPKAQRGGLAPRQRQRVRDYLAANLSQDISLAELAAVAGLSPAHFGRAYKQSTGRSPVQELIGMRIERAKELLADPSLHVIEVAALCGYDSPSAFAAVFRRQTGLTPRSWRREARR